jgi:cell division protein FtsW (lipid II flippase)
MVEILYLLVFPALFHTVYPLASGAVMNNMLLMLSMGFVMLERLNSGNAIKQFLIIIGGSIAFFFIPPLIKQKKLLKKTGLIMAITGIGLLLVTLVLGKTSFGANISFTIAGFTFQPSEFVKILFVLCAFSYGAFK